MEVQTPSMVRIGVHLVHIENTLFWWFAGAGAVHKLCFGAAAVENSDWDAVAAEKFELHVWIWNSPNTLFPFDFDWRIKGD